ncbi:MAG: hypothetical protein JNK82_41285 [Myxococcaceae bacterium]|nr:hypothetical protein [Myxococcaceae bacterium]
MSEKPDHSGRYTLIFTVGLTAVAMGAGFTYAHFRGPDGATGAWLSGDTLVVDEYREDEDSSTSRIAVLELRTGKRLNQRSPGALSVFAFAGNRLWLHAPRAPYVIEGWGLPSLETEVTANLSAADGNVCDDGAFVRVKLTDGTYTVLDLQSGKAVSDRKVTCTSSKGVLRVSAETGRGWLTSERDGTTERKQLTLDKRRLGGERTFLEPQYLCGEAQPLELDGDFFVMHRQALGTETGQLVSRVGESVRWSTPIPDPGTVHDAFLVKGELLVLVGHHGVTTFDVQSGKVLWRTGS